MCPYHDFYGFQCIKGIRILVCIFPAFSRIRTEYGEILYISPYSVQMLENAGKMPTRMTPNKDTCLLRSVHHFYGLFTAYLLYEEIMSFRLYYAKTICLLKIIIYGLQLFCITMSCFLFSTNKCAAFKVGGEYINWLINALIIYLLFAFRVFVFWFLLFNVRLIFAYVKSKISVKGI